MIEEREILLVNSGCSPFYRLASTPKKEPCPALSFYPHQKPTFLYLSKVDCFY
jgi:hypothetical protein